MPTYPPSLPDLDIVRGVTVAIGNQSMRTRMDHGPHKVRRMTSARPDAFTLAHPNFTDTEVETMEAFYDTTTKGGSLSFDMTDPLTGDTESWRFLSPPQFTSQGGDVWALSVELERLP